MYTYANALTLLGPKGKGKKTDNNTVSIFDEESKAIRLVLHATAIITWHEDGSIILFDGGWDTVTTRARIDAYRPNGYYIHKVKGVTWVAQYLGDGNHKEIEVWQGRFEAKP